MLVLTDYNYPICSVLDTEDDTVETIEYSDLVSAVSNSSLEVVGWTKYGVAKNVYIRFHNDSGDYFYNGYCSYSNLYGDISDTQVILFKESYESLEKIIPYLRKFNIADKPVQSNKDSYDYTFIATNDNIHLKLLDFNDLGEYHYLDVVALISVGNTIKGVEWKDDTLYVKGQPISAEASLKYLCTTSQDFNGSIKVVASERLNEFSATMRTLSHSISNKGYLSTTNLFPLYNINDWVTVDDSISLPDDIVHTSVKAVKNNHVILEDNSEGDLSTCASLISNDLHDNFKAILAKKSLLGGDTKSLEDSFNQKVFLDYNDYFSLSSHLVRNPETKYSQKYNHLIHTPFGRIKVVWKFGYNKSYLNGFFGSRITHTGCYWYSCESNNVKCTKQKDIVPYVKSGDEMIGVKQGIWGFNSYSYHSDTIFPISLREIRVLSTGLELIVNCIIKDDASVGLESWSGCAASFVSVPLLFLGSPIELKDNIYKVSGLMMDIYLERDVFNALEGNFVSDDLFKDFNMRFKMNRDLKRWNMKALMATMRKVEE